MIEIYLCGKDLHSRLDKILKRKLTAPFVILRTANGKPYVEGNPLHFSLSHSGEKGIIALSDRAIGVDLEIFQHRLRESVIERFTARERAEIASERDFLIHWTAREAYVKLYGLTLAESWTRIEFFDGKVYLDGEAQRVKVQHYNFDFGIAAICFEV